MAFANAISTEYMFLGMSTTQQAAEETIEAINLGQIPKELKKNNEFKKILNADMKSCFMKGITFCLINYVPRRYIVTIQNQKNLVHFTCHEILWM